MNKPALKRFATEARRELLERVELQARKIGIISDGVQKATIESSDAIFINGRQLKEKEKVQRNKLIARIREIGFERVMEEVAYTWFNRFTALRFMEVNDYLPTKVRVLSSTIPGSKEPDMIKEALTLDLKIDKEHVYELKLNNNDDELFKYLIIKHCNDLNRYMPFMFETIDDYTEILFPEGLLASDSFLKKMTNIEAIPENNWEKIEVIGWLYQYYIAEEKERVFKAKNKYKAEEIPFATQLFTPDWIVRYMVQNSLGRYWVEANPDHKGLINNWELYLQNTEEGFAEKIAPYINKDLKVEEIRCFDPAMGSGHILVYMFDVLYEIYEKSGYMEREIPRLIIENNLFGLDIDDRAYQLASFSVVMKAMEYNKRFLRSIEREGLILNLASIQETNTLTNEDIEFLAEGNTENLEEIRIFLQQFQDAKTIGSLIKVTKGDTRYLQQRLESIQTTPVTDLFEVEQREKAIYLLPKLIKQAQIMSLEFDILVTNPPYMGSGSMNKELGDYLKRNYPDSKADLFAAFMEVDHYLKKNGFYAAINQHAWMFLSSFERFRGKLIKNKYIESMLHLGSRAFEEIGGEVVQTTSFVYRNIAIKNTKGVYVRLINEKTASAKKEKVIEAIKFPSSPHRYLVNQDSLSRIPGNPIAYWASERTKEIFSNNIQLSEIAEPKQGLATANNDRFLRYWHEISYGDIGYNYRSEIEAAQSKKKWFPYNKGGSFRKWYGNQEYVVNWENNGEEIKNFVDENGKQRSRPQNTRYYFRESITWSFVSSSDFGVRYSPRGFIFDVGGSSLFPKEKDIKVFVGFLTSKLSNFFLSNLNPTLNFQVGNIGNIPLPNLNDDERDAIEALAIESISISKSDWDSFETSWDFVKHPFIMENANNTSIEEIFENWKNKTEMRFHRLQMIEESMNKILIDNYGLEDEVNPEVEVKDITISKAEIKRDIKSFISYAIGCSFGRYSLDNEGLIYAGGDFRPTQYKTCKIDEDNILPILNGAYFEDELVTNLVGFVRLVYGNETLEENLVFIAEAIR